MRIGIAQIDTVPGAFDQTVERMVAQSQRAAEQGVELLVFPLAALTGTDMVPFVDQASYMRDVAEALTNLSERLACPSIVPAPMSFGEGGPVFDAMLLERGEMRPLRTPAHVQAQEGDHGEHDIPEFEVGDLRFALALSYADLDTLDDYDYDVDAVLFLSGYPFAVDDPSTAMGADLDNARFAGDAQTTGSWLVGVASVGGYGDLVFSGSSMVLAPSGELAALAPAFEEALLVADIGVPFDGRLTDPLMPEVYDAPFHLWQAITLGLHDYVAKSGRTDVALCLDGTLGSGVLAALASDAVGPLHVHAVVGASAGALAPSCRELARRLRIDATSAVGQLPGYDTHDLDQLELATVARQHDALALSALDKTMLALDALPARVSAADLCPLGDVYRSDVLDMAHVRNTISPLFRRVELGEADAIELEADGAQSRVLANEGQVTRVDEVLLGFVEYERPLAELVADDEGQRDLVEEVLRAVRRSESLRRTMPPVLAMSTRTLDDLYYPLGSPWQDTHLDVVGDLPDRPQTPEGREVGTKKKYVPEAGMDLDATLAMLRDLVEQGGFLPSDFAPAEGDAPEDGRMPGWMTPFSEN